MDLKECVENVRGLSLEIEKFQQLVEYPCRCGHCDDVGQSECDLECPQRAMIEQMVGIIRHSGLAEKYLLRFLWLALDRRLMGRLVSLLTKEMRRGVLDPNDLDRLIGIVTNIRFSHSIFRRDHAGCGCHRDDLAG